MTGNQGPNPMTLRRRRGFTLVEVLLAVTILATLSAIAWTAVTQMFQTEEIVSDRQDRYRMIRLAMNRMATELSMAYVAGPDHGGEEVRGEPMDFEEDGQWGGGVYEPVQYGMIGRDDEVDFTSFAHVRTMEGEKASQHAQIGYSTERYTNEEGETVRRLVRRSSTNFDDDLTRGGHIHTMIPEVEELNFEFWDPGEPELGTEEEIAQGRWVSEWDTTSNEHSGRLPTRIRIELTLPPQTARSDAETFVTQTTLGMPELLEY